VLHDKFCVEAGLQVLRPVEDSDPIICKLEQLCICDLIERVRNEA
jgi:hypothetical protein